MSPRDRNELQKRIDKVMAEQFPDAPRLQREYATAAVIAGLGLTEEWTFPGAAGVWPSQARAEGGWGRGNQAVRSRWVSGWSVVGGEPSEGTLGVVDMDFCDCNRTLGGDQ